MIGDGCIFIELDVFITASTVILSPAANLTVAVIVAECYTPLYDRWIKTLPNPEETLAKITEKIPLGKRMTTSEEIANMTSAFVSRFPLSLTC